MNKNLDKAIKIVRAGGIIIYPTDTVFGIGCRVDKVDSVRKLFKLRNRPSEKAVPVLVSSIKMAEDYAEFSDTASNLAKKYWPGGLTLVLKNKKVLPVVIGSGSTVGVRMPHHSSILELIRKVGVPIIGCSANFAGEKTPYKMSDLDPKLVKLVDYVMPGRCSLKQASTVVDLSSNKLKILRKGTVKI